MMKLWRYLNASCGFWLPDEKSTINHQISLAKSSPSLRSRLACHIILKYDSLLPHSALCLPLKIHEAALLQQPYTELIEHLLRFDLQTKFKHLHPELHLLFSSDHWTPCVFELLWPLFIEGNYIAEHLFFTPAQTSFIFSDFHIVKFSLNCGITSYNSGLLKSPFLIIIVGLLVVFCLFIFSNITMIFL